MDKINKIANTINRLRIVPRIIILLYGVVFYRIVEWFTNIPDPTMSQAAFISSIVGASAAFFGLYVGSGNKK
tara:strand:+ start:3240 stop:3455 length:216 start_codon:yes stop_codon:yes gene_type:complete